MAHGYWQPPNSENLIACEGYYIPFNALNIEDTEIRWNSFLEQVSNELQHKENSLKVKKEWNNFFKGC